MSDVIHINISNYTYFILVIITYRIMHEYSHHIKMSIL